MDSGKRLCGNMSNSSSLVNEFPEKGLLNCQPFMNYGTQQDQMKWEDSSSLVDYGIGSKTSYSGYSQMLEQPKSSIPCESFSRIKTSGDADSKMEAIFQATRNQDWDPKAMLGNLFFLEQKIHQLQDLVHLIVGQRSQVVSCSDDFLVQQQHLVTADLTSIIVQLISTAGSLLPSVKHNFSNVNPSTPQLGQLCRPMFPTGEGSSACVLTQNKDGGKISDLSNDPVATVHRTEQISAIEEHDVKDEDDADEKEHLLPGSYEILQLEKEEILAPHTHFCTICGKGFKRDANLRMHMRGHGDEYKSVAALAKPNKEPSAEPMLIKRYSCPYAGCKRNKDHKKFQPLKTILCVKNHYKRSHCDKSFMCSRCNTKKFSVIADLKTHEKHCGRDKWLCSCGTTFSRKDKLFGHIALFQGHTPAITSDEKGPTGPSDGGENKVENSMAFNDGSTDSGIGDLMDFKANIDDPTACFSPLNFDNLSSSQEFPQPPYQDSDSAFSFLMSYIQKTGENLGPNGL